MLRKSKSHKLATPNKTEEALSKYKVKKTETTKNTLSKILGFDVKDLKSWDSFVSLLYRPTDPASLGVVRALFGLLMVFDVPEERGLSNVDIRWGDPYECRFPLFSFLRPLPLQWMCMVYMLMWIGAAGIMIGLFFRVSCIMFATTYWYIFLLDKSTWNNHTYLYGLIALLLIPSQANQYFSLDSIIWPKKDKTVPLWNYAILRYQLFILYFIAGLKKLDSDWLSGYSMAHLATHWVFEPFKSILTPEQIEFWIVHLGGFFLDLTITFWLFFDQTRIPALLFCGSFHLMNSQLFVIGMFPYVCLATMPIFCSPDWPKKLINQFKTFFGVTTSSSTTKKSAMNIQNFQPGVQKNFMTILLAAHVILQAFLPYSHFITKGYNNWTNGLYGYSWDMMVHNWNTILVMPRVVDESTGEEHFLDPEAWVQSDRWTKHADMVKQWACCVERNLQETQNMNDVSIYLDVWSSLNGRFQQRMYDPRINLLKADWSPFKPVPWLMPLMSDLSTWRQKMSAIEDHVFSWSNYSDVLFVADFPGLTLENYIAEGLNNVSLTVLSGDVTFEQLSPGSQSGAGEEVLLKQGQSSPVLGESFHYVHTKSPTPSCYMYTYINQTALDNRVLSSDGNQHKRSEGFLQHTYYRVKNFKTALRLVWNALMNLLFNVSFPRRVRVG